MSDLERLMYYINIQIEDEQEKKEALIMSGKKDIKTMREISYIDGRIGAFCKIGRHIHNFASIPKVYVPSEGENISVPNDR